MSLRIPKPNLCILSSVFFQIGVRAHAPQPHNFPRVDSIVSQFQKIE